MTEGAIDKFDRLCNEECSNIVEEDLDFLATVFKMMGVEQKSVFSKKIASLQ